MCVCSDISLKQTTVLHWCGFSPSKHSGLKDWRGVMDENTHHQNGTHNGPIGGMKDMWLASSSHRCLCWPSHKHCHPVTDAITQSQSQSQMPVFSLWSNHKMSLSHRPYHRPCHPVTDPDILSQTQSQGNVDCRLQWWCMLKGDACSTFSPGMK